MRKVRECEGLLRLGQLEGNVLLKSKREKAATSSFILKE